MKARKYLDWSGNVLTNDETFIVHGGVLMVIIRLLVFISSFLVSTSVAMAAHGEQHNVNSGNITALQVKELLASETKPVLIDVRSLPEYKFGHIPGAISVPSPAVKMLATRLPKDKSTLIIVYARGDSYLDVDRAFNTMLKMGYTNLKRFSGGILEWMDNHNPVKKGIRP